MAYSQAILSRAMANLQHAREQYEQEVALQRQQAYSSYPRLQQIDKRLRLTVAEAMSAAFRRGQDPTLAIAQLKEENLALQQERTQLLQDAGLVADYLDPHPFCTACGGTGYKGAIMCSCLKDLCIQEQKKELSSTFDPAKENFQNFQLHYYSIHPNSLYGFSPRENMASVLEDIQAYARHFSSKSPSLLFAGGTGLGKTFLSACVAYTVAEGGFSVVYSPANTLFHNYEIEKFSANAGNDSNLTEPYLAADLLIMDDLGTEMTTQFTLSVLYTIINTRLMEQRPTIISTNLSMDEIHRRYTPQIVSRLEGTYKGVIFFGDDIRLLKRDEA